MICDAESCNMKNVEYENDYDDVAHMIMMMVMVVVTITMMVKAGDNDSGDEIYDKC